MNGQAMDWPTAVVIIAMFACLAFIVWWCSP